MHRRWALVRDLPVFTEQKLPNVRYFSDDSPKALADDLLDLVSAARSDPPPLSSGTLNWAWCVGRLLEELGLAREESVPRPLLRIVS
jgi:hypothetical protein